MGKIFNFFTRPKIMFGIIFYKSWLIKYDST
nr:MAG TPA: hypothetical protein [Caudoviricetes sp.]